MPNHIINRLEIMGSKKEVKEIIKELNTFHPKEPSKSFDGHLRYRNKDSQHDYGFFNEETGEFSRRGKDTIKIIPEYYVQDFEEEWNQFPDYTKIVKQPEEINITSDGWLMCLDNRFSQNKPMKEVLDEIRTFIDKQPDKKEEKLANFFQGIKNYIEHGHATWYSWNVEKWGTKWNSYACKNIEWNVFEWQSAWSDVRKLINVISKKFPKVTFIYEWSDEDTGYNCGHIDYLNGELLCHEPEGGSKEAYDLAFKLQPDRKDEYEMVDGKYEYIDKD